MSRFDGKSTTSALSISITMSGENGEEIDFKERDRPEPPPHAMMDEVAEFVDGALRQLISKHAGQWSRLEITVRRG